MKKIFAVLVLFSMIFSLTGCGSDEKKPEVKKVETQKIEKTPEQIQVDKDDSKKSVAEEKVNKISKSDKTTKIKSEVVKIAESSGHPKLYDDWKEVKSFYKNDDVYEKYVYIDKESPSSFYKDASLAFYKMKDTVEEIHIYPQKIWGNLSLEETFNFVSDYVPKNSRSYMMIDHKQLIPEETNTDKTSYYWLHYGSEKSRYGNNQYSITFYVKDKYVTEIMLSESPYNMFTDGRKSKGWIEQDWNTKGIF